MNEKKKLVSSENIDKTVCTRQQQYANIYFFTFISTEKFCELVHIHSRLKLEHRRPLCNERERDPLHILLVATRCYAHYIMRAVSLSVRLCE